MFGFVPKQDRRIILSVYISFSSDNTPSLYLYRQADYRPVVRVVNLFKPQHHSAGDCLTSNHIIVMDNDSYKVCAA